MSKSIQLKDKNNEKYYPHPYYPVGSIYLSVNNTNPSRWFGGTWSLIAQGRTLVGVDTNDTDFNTVQKTGGSKTHKHTTGNHTLTTSQIPSHAHTVYLLNRSDSGETRSNIYGGSGVTRVLSYSNEGYDTNAKGWWNSAGITYTGGGQAHNHGDTGNGSNLQPYFTCYIWCRTA